MTLGIDEGKHYHLVRIGGSSSTSATLAVRLPPFTGPCPACAAPPPPPASLLARLRYSSSPALPRALPARPSCPS